MVFNTAATILKTIQLSADVIGIIVTIPYLLSIILIKRFCITSNLFVAHVLCANLYLCIITLIFGLFDIFYIDNSKTICPFSVYARYSAVCVAVNALAVVSLNQLCRIVYPRVLLFKKNLWALIRCGIQWFLAFGLSSVTLANDYQVGISMGSQIKHSKVFPNRMKLSELCRPC
ncbi:unnamed protein product [Rotaria sp. Silwood2]|nr:unnamed protein product [Rotaria sp. Silwood2]CAF4282646.1 unnamed protein product [Rotaria sp. Silwood2]CAF4426425.1 unnamed protein product [Rotaria sp. Silwood2]